MRVCVCVRVCVCACACVCGCVKSAHGFLLADLAGEPILTLFVVASVVTFVICMRIISSRHITSVAFYFLLGLLDV